MLEKPEKQHSISIVLSFFVIGLLFLTFTFDQSHSIALGFSPSFEALYYVDDKISPLLGSAFKVPYKKELVPVQFLSKRARSVPTT